MKTVTNKTRTPLSIPLPRDKRLHLGPGKSGQIAPNAADHPPLKKLVDAGQIEIHDERTHVGGGGGGSRPGRSRMVGHSSGGTGHRSGDR